jgi:hypothetical protein
VHQLAANWQGRTHVNQLNQSFHILNQIDTNVQPNRVTPCGAGDFDIYHFLPHTQGIGGARRP